MTRQICDPVQDSELECLNSFPKGARGYLEEKKLIELLNALCGHYGYGRVPQIAEQIKNIWYNPDMVVEYETQRQKQLEYLAECKATLNL